MTRRRLALASFTLLLVGGSTLGYWMGRARAAGIPTMQPMVYSGVLTDTTGAPASGMKNIQVSLSTQDAAQKCSTDPVPVMLQQGGAFQIVLPDACLTLVRQNPDLWVEAFVDGASLGKSKLGAVPYAVEAAHAVSADVPTGALQTTIAAMQARLTALEGTFAKASFVAYNDGGGDQSTTAKWPGNKTAINNGGVWSTTNYEFTAPVNGYYFFSWTAYASSATGRAFLQKNGADQMQTDSNGKAESLVLELAAGDKVSMAGKAAYPMTWYGAFAHNAFSGYLLAPK